MDPKVVFWTGAWLNLLVAVLLMTSAVRAVRRGEVLLHRRRMLTAGSLVLLFLAGYGTKLLLFGREQLYLWNAFYVWTLRFHEVCIFFWLAGGLTALFLAWRLRLAEAPDGSHSVYELPLVLARLRLHRRAGRTAWYASWLALISSAVVLYGMYARTGLL